MVDTSATLVASDGYSPDQEVDGVVELNTVLANMDQVKACVANQYLNYTSGRIPGAQDAKSIEALMASMQKNGWNLRQMMVDMTQIDMFLYRKVH